MVEPPETEEAKQVAEALVLLSSASSQGLLPCLNKLEDALMKVKPSQFKDSRNVLGCAILELATKELLNHHNLHVRVSMASCFCHILRIMMPDGSFCRNVLLKEVLGFVVSEFDNISDKSCGLYHRRVSILRVFEKARLFLLMVDLQCDELIVTMFKCFLRNISDSQPDAVFSSMGSVMILTVLKMKRVPFELTLTLLQTVRNEFEAISRVAHTLAERVLENCALKLASRMSEAVQHLGFPLDDYSQNVAYVISRQFESRAQTEVMDSDDDDSEENVGQSVRGDTPTSFHPNKKLLVLDINGLLADIVQGISERYPCDLIVSNKAVFIRPFCSDFLRFCFKKFNVGVWSSRAKKNMDKIVTHIFGSSEHKLLFCWNEFHCTKTRFKTVENPDKPLVLKELRKLWENKYNDLPWKEDVFNKKNTLLLDDSPYKALRNPAHTAIFPSPYHFRNYEDSSLGLGGDLRKYLEGLADAENVQEYVSKHPFGQNAITDSDASWAFYSKIVDHESSCAEEVASSSRLVVDK